LETQILIAKRLIVEYKAGPRGAQKRAIVMDEAMAMLYGEGNYHHITFSFV
jgi:hypothetical protein